MGQSGGKGKGGLARPFRGPAGGRGRPPYPPEIPVKMTLPFNKINPTLNLR